MSLQRTAELRQMISHARSYDLGTPQDLTLRKKHPLIQGAVYSAISSIHLGSTDQFLECTVDSSMPSVTASSETSAIPLYGTS